MTKTTNTIICDFCGSTKNDIFYLYKFQFATSRSIYEVGLIAIFELMNKWILEKLYHLSPSEILLLRPDLVNEFLQWHKPDEDIKNWYFTNYRMCTSCYQSYKQNVPER